MMEGAPSYSSSSAQVVGVEQSHFQEAAESAFGGVSSQKYAEKLSEDYAAPQAMHEAAIASQFKKARQTARSMSSDMDDNEDRAEHEDEEDEEDQESGLDEHDRVKTHPAADWSVTQKTATQLGFVFETTAPFVAEMPESQPAEEAQEIMQKVIPSVPLPDIQPFLQQTLPTTPMESSLSPDTIKHSPSTEAAQSQRGSFPGITAAPVTSLSMPYGNHDSGGMADGEMLFDAEIGGELAFIPQSGGVPGPLSPTGGHFLAQSSPGGVGLGMPVTSAALTGKTRIEILAGPAKHQVKEFNILPNNVLIVNYDPKNSDYILIRLICDKKMRRREKVIFMSAVSAKHAANEDGEIILHNLKISKEMLQGRTKGFKFCLAYTLVCDGKEVETIKSNTFYIWSNVNQPGFPRKQREQYLAQRIKANKRRRKS